MTLGESVGIPCDYYLAQINHKSHLGLYFCDIWITEPVPVVNPGLQQTTNLRLFACWAIIQTYFFQNHFFSKNCFRNTINISMSGSKLLANVINRQQELPL